MAFPARYPGRCAATGRQIKPGDIIRAIGRGRFALASAPVSDVIRIGDKTFYRNKAGRCEDAPCCGCCTI
jgi:hypothetical protein